MLMLSRVVCDLDLTGDEGLLPRAVGTVDRKVVMALLHRAALNAVGYQHQHVIDGDLLLAGDRLLTLRNELALHPGTLEGVWLRIGCPGI